MIHDCDACEGVAHSNGQLGEGVGDLSTISCSIIKAQKDAE
jgi:hypothetical protein